MNINKIETFPDFNYTIGKDGTVNISQETAEKIFEALKDREPYDFNPENYDTETGLNLDALEFEARINKPDGTYEVIQLSSHGAMVTEYIIVDGDEEVSIIYSPEPAGNPNEPGDKMRGGGMNANPHNCEDKALSAIEQVNYHGTLNRSVTELVHIDYQNGVFVFALPSNMIPDIVPHQDNILDMICYKLNPEGGYTITIQTFNFGDATYYKNEAFHPYFDTEITPPVGVQVGDEIFTVSKFLEQRQGNIFTAMKDLKKAIFAPMNQYFNRSKFKPFIKLRTTKYAATLTALSGFNIDSSHLGVWTNKLKYFCLELIRYKDQPFDPSDPENASNYASVKPGESDTISVQIKTEIFQPRES